MFIKKLILSFGLLMAYVGTAEALTCESQSSGNWNSSSTWTNCGNGIPGSLDVVTIKDTHVVSLNVDTAELGGLTVEVGGDLNVAQRLMNSELGFSINLHQSATQKVDLSNALMNLSAHITINAKGQDMWLGGVLGRFEVHLNSDAETRLMGKIGDNNSNRPTAFVTDSPGTTVFVIAYDSTGNFNTNGNVTFHDDVLILKSVVFKGGANTVVFNGTINADPNALSFDGSMQFIYSGSYTIQFNQNIGEVNELDILEVYNSNLGTVELNTPIVLIDYVQLTNVLLNSPTETVFMKSCWYCEGYIRTAIGANPNELIINNGSNFVGAIGDNNQPLSILKINLGGVNFYSSSITTTVSQEYSGDCNFDSFTNEVVLNSPQIIFQNNVNINDTNLTLNTTDTTGATKIEGVLSGSGNLIKNGVGTLDFYTINTLSGNIILNEGQLINQFPSNAIFPNAPRISLAANTQADLGSSSLSDEYFIGNNQSVNGNGIFTDKLRVESGGIVAPGLSGGLSTGSLMADEINMLSGSVLSIDINGTAAGTEYDQLVLGQGGSLDNDFLGGATLDLSLDFIPEVGDTFKIISSSSPLTGTFFGLPEGSQLMSNGSSFTINYGAGGGNDVVLIVVGAPFPIIHVDASAAPGGDGGSWENAFNNMQDALNTVFANSGQEIWVAQGVYYPDEGANQVDNDRLASFKLIDGVSVYGGFDGTETALSQRNPDLNITILSGDVSQDDVNSDGNHILEDSLDRVGLNSYQVVNGSDVDTSTLFSGFFVTAGHANEINPYGAGMYCGYGSNGPSIDKTTFIGNYAKISGAATYGCSQDVRGSNFINNYSRDFANVVAIGGYYENVLFQGNISFIQGGALSSEVEPITIVNSRFIANLSSNQSGTGAVGALLSDTDTIIENTLFSGNQGRALFLDGVGTATLTNVTMTGNLATDFGGAISMSASNTLNLRNSIIWNNHDSTTDTTATSSIELNGGTYTQFNSLVQNFVATNNGNKDEDPLFFSDSSPATAPNTSGNAHLNIGSPAINAGDNSFVLINNDLEGSPRIQNTTVDMGVFEFSGHTVSVAVSGLLGDQIVFQNNGIDDLVFYTDGTQDFVVPLANTDSYEVTIITQPEIPNQICVMSNASGTISGLDITVTVNCATNQYSVGGIVSGITNGVLTLQNNGGDDLQLTQDGAFEFSGLIDDLSQYVVTFSSNTNNQPQSCVVSGGNNGLGDGTGQISGNNVADVVVQCTSDTQYRVGGSVTGLLGAGLVLQNSGADDIQILNDGLFTFNPINDLSDYSISVKTNPIMPNQTCVVTSGNSGNNDGTGQLTGSDYMGIIVTCTNKIYSLSGRVSGLINGTLTLQNNGGNDLQISNNRSFVFNNPLDDFSNYAVTVASNTSDKDQSCVVTGGNSGQNNGTGQIEGRSYSQIVVTCTSANQHTVSGTVSGLLSGSVMLQNNAGNDLEVTNDGAFTFGLFNNLSTYNVTVKTNPSSPNQTCLVTDGNGQLDGNDISIVVTCTINQYTVSGTVSGIVNGTLTLQNNGGDDLDLTQDGAFEFSPLDDFSGYAVTVSSNTNIQNQTCVITGGNSVQDDGTGQLAGGDVTDVVVVCTSDDQYSVGGTVTGLFNGAITIQNNGGDDFQLTSDGMFTFTTIFNDLSNYAVTVQSNTSSPAQTCVITGGNSGQNDGTGQLAGSNIVDIVVNCSNNQYSVGGTISGLLSNTLILQNNAGDDLQFFSNGAFNFTTKLDDLSTFAVTVKTNPSSPNQICLIMGGNSGQNDGTGQLAGSDYTDIVVTCTTTQYSIGGTVSGLLGGTLVLQNNAGNDLPLSSDGLFEFKTELDDLSSYAVTVKINPSVPEQTCSVTGGSSAENDGTGEIEGGDYAGIVVSCTTNQYFVGGMASGLAKTNTVTLALGAEDLILNSNDAFVFLNPLTDQSNYSVSVTDQPTVPNQTCELLNPSGVIEGLDILDIEVNCTTNQYTIGGFVSGLHSGNNLVIQNNNSDDLTLSSDSDFDFVTAIDDLQPYDVSILNQPTDPNQTCELNNNSGSIAGGNVITVSITCEFGDDLIYRGGFEQILTE